MNKIDQAMLAVPRIEFLPLEMKKKAAIDVPLPIGFGQTNSQPTVVRWMLKWLDPQPGEKVLDVGSGSGWSTALLAHLVGPEGAVYAVEKIPQLVHFGEQNCRRVGAHNVKFFEAGADYGLPDSAPFDRILVSAAATELPRALLNQLKVGGRMVIPIKKSIYVVDKTSDSDYKATEHPGFLFVPLI